MRIYFPDDLLPYRRRLDWKERRQWLLQWRRITRAHPRYRTFFWATFAITFVVISPSALLLLRNEGDRLISSFVLTGLTVFFSYWMAAVIPYLFTRSELKRLIKSQISQKERAD